MTAVAVRSAVEPQSALIEEAATLRLVTRPEIEAGQVRTDTVPRASARTRVLLVRGRPVAYVKTNLPAPAAQLPPGRGLRVVGGPDWTAARALAPLERERQVLLALSATRLTPRLIAATPTSVWTAPTPGTDLGEWARSGSSVAPDLFEIARGWGRVLAGLHAVRIPPGAPECVRPDPLAESVGDLRDHRLRELRQLSIELRDRWQPTAWIHGGLGPHSVLVDPLDVIDVRLVGFGRAGVGDPGWDLALALECVADQARICSLEPARLEEELLLGYRRAGGQARVAPGYRALAACRLAADRTPAVTRQRSGSPAMMILGRGGPAGWAG